MVSSIYSKNGCRKLTFIGMDDVLPKPFTRKSLLDMLEKHLAHMKKMSPTMEAPLSATAPSIAQSSASHSIKDDSSPAQSPAASLGNWQSPTTYTGVSPMHANMQTTYLPVQNTTGYPIDQNQMHFQPSQTQINQHGAGAHRRQVSEISGPNDMTSYNKRQRVYGQSPNGMVNPMQQGRPV